MSYLNQFIIQCHENIINNQGYESKRALDYLNGRNINQESINLHKIGYCFYNQKIPQEICFYGKDKIEDDNKGYSYFIKGRIIVPIYSEFGNLVGFATRKPSSDPGNTWWNISKPFHKSEHLFMLDKSRKHIFKDNKIYIVEGYIDAIILSQEGIKNVVGIMGTNLSPRQIGLIARYCNNICLCLDVDKNNAGQKAQGKSIYSMKKFDFYDSISIIEGLPEGEDPDVYVTKYGIEKLIGLERKMTEAEINHIYKEVLSQMKR